MRFDLLIRGGHVIDPRAGLDGEYDVAIAGGKVVACDSHIPADTALKIVDAAGLLVLPGLIDLHTHVFHKCTYWGVDPDTMAHDSGVTTWVDAGSAGAMGLRGLRDYVAKRAEVRVRAFVNVSLIGLVGPDFELRLPDYVDPDLLSRAVGDSADLVVGIKVRMSTPTVGADPLLGMRVAREVGDRLGLPIMVHVSDAPPEVTEVLALMREGDLVTHCCTAGSMKLVDGDGMPLAALKSARDRGVLLDLGHGAGGFAFSSAQALVNAGIFPDVISTDLHQMSRHASAVISNDAAASPVIRLRDEPTERLDLPLCMSKLLALGLSLQEVVAATTEKPASVLASSDELGTLKPGARGDIGLFSVEDGDFLFRDVFGGSLSGRQRLRNVGTYVAGRLLRGCEDADSPPWVERVPAGPAGG